MSGWRVVSWMRTWAGSFAMASRAFGVWWTKSSSSDPKFPEQLPRNGLAVGVGQQQTPRAACGSRRHTGPARKTARCCTTTLTRTRPRCSDRTPASCTPASGRACEAPPFSRAGAVPVNESTPRTAVVANCL